MPEIISRSEAIKLGLKRYFTARPCKNGHIAERLASNGCCLECSKNRQQLPEVKRQRKAISKKSEKNRNQEKRRAWIRQNREKLLSNQRRYYQKNKRARLARSKERYKKWAKEHADELKKYRRLYYKQHRDHINKRNQEYHYKNRSHLNSLSSKYYYDGPSNPKGELQWLRRNQAQLRSVKRLLKNLRHGLLPSPSSASTTPTGSPK